MPECPGINVVTGAFSYTGMYIARRLLRQGERVITVTGHPGRPHPFGEEVVALPLCFEDPGRLAAGFRGASVFYNTYWIRFPCGKVTFERAIENSRALLQAAKEAGVRRIVHISITQASEDSPLPYFKGKAIVERLVAQSGLSYAILRPTVIFGPEDILINNIAWFLRSFPLFPVFGSGAYRIQPVFADDLASLAVDAGHGEENFILDAVGPEVFTYDQLVRLVARRIGVSSRIVHVPPLAAYLLARLAGLLVRDVVITRDEIRGLVSDLLVSTGQPTARTRLSDWLEAHKDTVGLRYASELKRHYRDS